MKSLINSLTTYKKLNNLTIAMLELLPHTVLSKYVRLS
jgi:hypothetical protein